MAPFVASLWSPMYDMYNFSVPAIATTDGYALGGFEMALACDKRVASSTAKLDWWTTGVDISAQNTTFSNIVFEKFVSWITLFLFHRAVLFLNSADRSTNGIEACGREPLCGSCLRSGRSWIT